jgi:hypothetical protein
VPQKEGVGVLTLRTMLVVFSTPVGIDVGVCEKISPFVVVMGVIGVCRQPVNTSVRMRYMDIVVFVGGVDMCTNLLL